MTRPDDPADRPPLELEVEVPGTPEEVWRAIATGPGISAWLQPTEVEPRPGGRFSFDLGAGPQSGTVTAWEPPHRFGQEVTWRPGRGRPAARLATEWHVRARAGGTCVVRMVMSGFGSAEDWDEELEGIATGMRAALASLRLYLVHFPGRAGVWVRAATAAPGPPDRSWARLTEAIGLAGAVEGAPAGTAGAGEPALSGVVERVVDGGADHSLLLRVERPVPGLANVFVLGNGGWVGLEACLYGDGAAAVAARLEPRWRRFLDSRFPAAGGT
jgi:uncharacterized protein YndB with AHSA1/START domain